MRGERREIFANQNARRITTNPGAHHVPKFTTRTFDCESLEALCDRDDCIAEAAVETVIRDRKGRVLFESVRCLTHGGIGVPRKAALIEETYSQDAMRRARER